jgi:DNA-binding NarL/FixJ family response regulator
MVRVPILLADDHAVVRDGLRAIIEREPDLAVVAEVDNGDDAVSQAERLQPAVVLMDIAMPRLGGIEAAAQIRLHCPQTHVIVLSMHATAEHVFRALQAGVSGYVVKESAGSEVLLAIRSVQAGGRYLSARIASIVVEGYVRQHRGSSPLDGLSERERQVLQAVVEGGSSADIARQFSLSRKTIETYRSRLMRKLGVSDLAGLVRFALQNGVSTPPRPPRRE